MDYKYIEQLLDKYWRCETSIEEENILRAFFSQEIVPTAFAKYRDLFVCQQNDKHEQVLSDDFDEKILSMIEEPATPAEQPRRRTLLLRLKPLFKAAAVVAIIVTLGNAAQLAIGPKNTDDDINYASYKDTYKDPSVAYDKVESALELVSEGMSQAQNADSLQGMKNGADTVITK